MIIHLVTTSDFDTGILKSVVEFLLLKGNSLSISSEIFDKSELNEPGKNKPNKLVQTTTAYRNIKAIHTNEYVICLSRNPLAVLGVETDASFFGIGQAANNFGSYHKNIHIVSCPSKNKSFGVNEIHYFVFEIINNILWGLNPSDSVHSIFVHKDNCFFGNFDPHYSRYKRIPDVICAGCWEKIKNSAPESALLQLLATLTEIKNRTVYIPHVSTEQIKAIELNTKTMQIKLEGENGQVIELSGLQKVLYIFFLLHPEGVRREKILKSESELINIYNKVFPGKDDDIKTESLQRLGKYFDDKKSKLNKQLTQILGTTVSAKYFIVNNEGIFKIDLPENKIKIIE